MVKAMYAGVAGLKAHQSKMDVISNNIANVNTWGYKTMDTSFKESIYQTMTGGSGGSTAEGGMGGTNPSMVGYGAMVSTISSNFTKGTQVPTGQALDLFIDGTGFFAVGPMYGEGESVSPANLNMSRVGDFRVINNYLVDGNGRYVYGFSMGKGSCGYVPEAQRTVVETPDVPIPDGNVPPTSTIDKNGIKTVTTYVPHAADDGLMTVTTTVTQKKSAAPLLPGIEVPTPDKTLQRIVDSLSAQAGVTGITYTLSDNKKEVTIKTKAPSANGITVLTAAGFPPAQPQDADDIKAAAELATAAAAGAAIYDIDPDNHSNVIVTTVQTVDSRGKAPDGTPYIAGVTSGSTKAVIDQAIIDLNLAEAPNNRFYKIEDANDIYSITEIHTTTSEEPMPLPDAKLTENEDGSTVTISYKDNGKNDGTATMVTTTVTPVDENAEYKGAPFDDGRMIFDPKSGTYKMAAGVDTLKPLKLPTTGIYYEDGVAKEEKDIQLGSFSIKKDGKIYGTSAATGKTYLLGAVALTSVSNPSGMTKADGPYYTPGVSSGSPKINEAGGSTGELASEFLESANVDIATEFSSMITTQRGFQANSKIITVTDEMLQELVNMKR